MHHYLDQYMPLQGLARRQAVSRWCRKRNYGTWRRLNSPHRGLLGERLLIASSAESSCQFFSSPSFMVESLSTLLWW